MAQGTILGVVSSRGDYPRPTIVHWSLPGIAAASQSTELIEIDIPGMASDEVSPTLAGDANVIQLVSFNADSTSTDFDISILTKNDIDALDTMYEVFKYTGANLSVVDSDLGNLLIGNHDSEIDSRKNKLYVFIKNDDAVNGTGDIRLELGLLIFD